MNKAPIGAYFLKMDNASGKFHQQNQTKIASSQCAALNTEHDCMMLSLSFCPSVLIEIQCSDHQIQIHLNKSMQWLGNRGQCIAYQCAQVLYLR